MFKKPTLGWRTKEKLIKEFRQGAVADRWSERRLLILLAEYRMNCRREFMEELADIVDIQPMCDYYTVSRADLFRMAR
jgi:hypothetical protein